jgi:hypothetical protein
MYQANVLKAMELGCGVPALVPNLHIKAIGTRSAGTFIGAALALGFSSHDIVTALSKLHVNLFRPDVRNLVLKNVWALDDGAHLTKFCEDFVTQALRLPISATLADIEAVHGVRLFVQVSDLDNKRSLTLPASTQLSVAMRATCSIGLIFSPVEVENVLCADACMMFGRDNLVNDMTREVCAHHVASIGYSVGKPSRPKTLTDFYSTLLSLIVITDASSCSPREVSVTTPWTSYPGSGTFSFHADKVVEMLDAHWKAHCTPDFLARFSTSEPNDAIFL